MNKLIRFYNENRYIVWLCILIIIAIIAFIQILNNIVSKENNETESMGQTLIGQNSVSQNTEENINQNYSIITGNEVNEDISIVISEFIEYCNNKEPEKAYELLTDECKEIFYPTLEDFTEKYYSKLFNSKKTYFYQAWITNENYYTYKIDFMDDMLASGTAINETITDYYTVYKQNETYKLNINKLVKIQNINKSATKDNITIKIKRKRIYMNYETYEIEVQNNSKQEIMLDDLKMANTVYIEDINQQKYYWYNYEILDEDITIRRIQKKEIEIKFNKEYRANCEISKIVFPRIVIDEENLLRFEINI